MHNWLELHMLGREKMEDALRAAEERRRGRVERARGENRPATLILSGGEVLRLRARRGNLLVTCRTGTLWATTNRSKLDTVLSTGESVSYRDGGTIVIEALRTSTLRLEFEMDLRVAVEDPLRPALLFG